MRATGISSQTVELAVPSRGRHHSLPHKAVRAILTNPVSHTGLTSESPSSILRLY